MRYVNISGYAGYRADMRKANANLVLWQIQCSDYPADMRNSKWRKEMWPSSFFNKHPERRAML